MHDYVADCMTELDGQLQDFHYLRLLMDMYLAVRQNGGSLDVFGIDDNNLGNYTLILVPALMYLPKGFVGKLQKSRARVLYGPRTGAKTQDMQIPGNLIASDLFNVLGVSVIQIDALPCDLPVVCEWTNRAKQVYMGHLAV